VEFVCVTKNESMTPTCGISLLTTAFEMFGKHNIIKLPSNAEYEIEKVLNVLLHAATSTSNSLESASNDLKRKNPDAEIPSSDTIFNYVNCNNIEDILSSFRTINPEIFNMMKLEGKIHDVAIDFHHVPFYGDKNTPLIRGMKPKNGTSWGYEYCTLDIIGDDKLTLDVIPISALKKDYSTLIELLLKRLESISVKIGTVYSDKGFCNDDTISTLTKLKINFVIACILNKKIKRELENFKKENGHKPTVFEYQFNKNGTKFNLVAVPHEKKDYILFATNKDVKSIEEFEKSIPEEYKKRWNIETGYRVKNEFKIRTCTKSPVARTLFFIIQCTLYNILNMLKSVLKITAHEMKSIINEDIGKSVKWGIKSLGGMPVRLLLRQLKKYIRERDRLLRTQLNEV
jgi:Transposase DDE domain